ncbi:hypothetical protein ACR30T_01765 [Neisseria gonorrhoeae]
MNETDLPKLLSVINRFTDIDKNWSCVLLFWIQRASGYLEMMTLDDDENTATFLIEKLEKLLEPLPIDIDNTTFAEALADDFEILFLIANTVLNTGIHLKKALRNFVLDILRYLIN